MLSNISYISFKLLDFYRKVESLNPQDPVSLKVKKSKKDEEAVIVVTGQKYNRNGSIAWK